MEHEATQRDNNGFELIEPHARDDPRDRPGAWLPQVRLEKCAVWITSRATLGLLGNPEAVALRPDPRMGWVGFGAAEKGEPDAYLVSSPGPRSSQGLVSGRKFCSHHGIPRDEHKTYPASLEDGLLVIERGRHVEKRLREPSPTCRPKPPNTNYSREGVA